MRAGPGVNGIPPAGTVDYYDTLAGRNGGLRSTARFARRFMERTVYHCGGGYASAVRPDLILPMVEWVDVRRRELPPRCGARSDAGYTRRG